MASTPMPIGVKDGAKVTREAPPCHVENDAKPLIYLDKNYRKLLINLTNKP
jgi:hypothetical protein